MNAIQTAMTDPVDATGVVGKATFTTHAYVADPLVRVQTPGPIHVTVNTEKTQETGQPRQQTGLTKVLVRLIGLRPVRSAILGRSRQDATAIRDRRNSGVAGEYPLDRQTVFAIGRALGHRLAAR